MLRRRGLFGGLLGLGAGAAAIAVTQKPLHKDVPVQDASILRDLADALRELKEVKALVAQPPPIIEPIMTEAELAELRRRVFLSQLSSDPTFRANVAHYVFEAAKKQATEKPHNVSVPPKDMVFQSTSGALFTALAQGGIMHYDKGAWKKIRG